VTGNASAAEREMGEGNWQGYATRLEMHGDSPGIKIKFIEKAFQIINMGAQTERQSPSAPSLHRPLHDESGPGTWHAEVILPALRFTG
jgi:hypothetical protein